MNEPGDHAPLPPKPAGLLEAIASLRAATRQAVAGARP
jgi:hypothetical protein